jgi:hypothetical protein
MAPFMPQRRSGGEAKPHISTKIGRLAGAADEKVPMGLGGRMEAGGKSSLHAQRAGCRFWREQLARRRDRGTSPDASQAIETT